MNLTPAHRELLGMRTLNKFAIQVGYRDRPDLTAALTNLLDEGYVRLIDTYYSTTFKRFLNVYQLTNIGIKLCADEHIEARNP